MSTVLLNNNTKVNNNIKGEDNMHILNRGNKNTQNALEGLYNEGVSVNKALIEQIAADIDGTAIDNIQRAFAVVSYAYGNMVGITTVGINSILTLMNKPEQFFENGVLNAAKVRKDLKGFAKKDKIVKGYRYVSVFKDQLNRDMAISRFNRLSAFVRVSKHEIIEFENRIAMIDPKCCTKEDLALIAKDFDVIGRAMQELSIDSTKDKSKDIGLDVTDFVETRTKAKSSLIKKRGNLTNNLEDIIAQHQNKKNITSSYEMKLSVDRKPLREVSVDNRIEYSDAYIEDLSGDNMDEINAGYQEAFTELIDKVYKTTTDSMYDVYKDTIETLNRSKEDSAKNALTIIKCCRKAIDMINSLYAMKVEDASVSSAYIKSEAFKLRAALYTQGSKFGFDPQTVVKLAISAAFCYVSNDKVYVKKNPSFTALWAIFEKEYVLDYVCNNYEDDRTKALDVMLEVKSLTYDLCLNDELDFVDGFAETEYGFVVVREKYTGKAIVTENGLKALIDVYAYEPLEAVFIDEVCTKNVQNLNDRMAIPEGYVMTEENAENIKDDFNTINKMIMTSQAAAISQSGYLVIKSGNHISVIGKVIAMNKLNKVKDSFLTMKGGVVYL